MKESSTAEGFSPEQQHYLQGFTLGADVARAVQGLPILSGSAVGGSGTTVKLSSQGVEISPPGAESSDGNPEAIHRHAQDQVLASGGTLCKEEVAKREKNALDIWRDMKLRAEEHQFPKGTDVFLWKFQGMFYVAPAQNAYMCRMRFPGGKVRSYQLWGIADIAQRYAGGYADVTTRGNLQLREIPASAPTHVLAELQNLGVIFRGSGADNVRNVTATPTSGFDPQELIETLPLAEAMNQHLLNHRELYGLPRKFNIAFEGGGRIASLDDTNDIGFRAVRIDQAGATAETPAGVYFRLTLGGITGHLDFARPTGVLLDPGECVAVADAILRVYIRHGDRTDRKKARLKYLLDDWGFDKFLTHVEEELGRSLRRFGLDRCEPHPADDRQGHIGFHAARQPGRYYVGVVLPVGRMTSLQLRAIAELSERYGNREVRLTAWQNLLIPGIDEADIPAVQQALVRMGLDWQATSFRGGLVACTGNAGCKYAAADTKGHAMQLAAHLESQLTLDQPLNIHLTGCSHSCAQHYIGDIGLLGASVEADDDEMVEGYQIFVGGGWNERQACGRELFGPTAFAEIPSLVQRMIVGYQAHRHGPTESFAEFCQRHSIDELRGLVGQASTTPAGVS
jgi:ferredoxin-nitrite reductase